MNSMSTYARRSHPASRKGLGWGITLLVLVVAGAAAYQPVQRWVALPPIPVAVSLRGDLPDSGSLASQLRDDITEAQATQKLAEQTGYAAVTKAILDGYTTKLTTLARAGVREMDETKPEDLNDPATMLQRTGYWNGYANRIAEQTRVNVAVGARGECEKTGCVLHFAW